MVYKWFFPKRVGLDVYDRVMQKAAKDLKVNLETKYAFISEPAWRFQPGDVKRKKHMEMTRRKDREEVKRIISTIFAKKGIRHPPSTVAELKKKFNIKDDTDI
jgi:hypothetical protein